MGEHEPIDMRRNENAALAHCAEHTLWASMNRLCQSEAEAQMTYSPLPPSSNKPPFGDVEALAASLQIANRLVDEAAG